MHRTGRTSSRPLRVLVQLLAAFIILSHGFRAQEVAPKRLVPKDSEKMKAIRSESLSGDGRWLGYLLVQGDTRRGPPAELGGTEDETPQAQRTTELNLLNLETNEKLQVKDVVDFEIGLDGRFLAYTMKREDASKASSKEGGKPEVKSEGEGKAPVAVEPAKGEEVKAKEVPPEPGNPEPAKVEEAKAEEKTGEAKTEELKAEAAKPEEVKPEAAPPETAKLAEQPAGAERPREGGGRRGARGGGRGGRGPGAGTGRPGFGTGAAGAAVEPQVSAAETWKPRGSTLILRDLLAGSTFSIPHVESYKFSKDGTEIVVVQAPTDPNQSGISIRRLDRPDAPTALVTGRGRYSNVNWSKDGNELSFFADPAPPEAPKLPLPVAAAKEPEEKKAPLEPAEKPVSEVETPATKAAETLPLPTEPATKVADAKPAEPAPPVRLYVWRRGDATAKEVVGPGVAAFPKGQDLVRGQATFSSDRSKVFVTLKKTVEKPKADAAEAKAEVTTPKSPAPFREPRASAPAAARAGAGAGAGAGTRAGTGDKEAELDVWHWKDQKIAPMKGKGRQREESILHVADTGSGILRALGDSRLPTLTLNETGTYGIATDGEPYAQERTWDREYQDYYVVEVATGRRQLLARHVPRGPRWTEDGSFLLAFENGAWQKIEPATLARTNLTAASDIHYEDDEWPGDATGTIGRVLPGGREILVSDGFDLWAVPLDGAIGRNLTRTGQKERVRYRLVVLDDENPYGDDGRSLLLGTVDEKTRAKGFARLDYDSGRMERLLLVDKDLGAPRRAKNAERFVVSIQDSNSPQDLWVANAGFTGLRRVTDANPWLKEYDLPKSELVHWRSDDGVPLEGILLPPAGYEKGKRYPTIVLMYEKQSQGLHQFRSPGLMLNPQSWAQNGYAVFLPDIVYQIGRPGPSAVKCVVPGVLRLVEMGITDIDRVGLCGHSWGGYETAFIITQTKLFRAAIAGAPVINMVSAYNGIRWSTGLPRQFQYERTQSRIGGTLWDFPERFIANSGIFHLEHVTTPVLIEFGNNDGAVPWYQGIEYYLGMRRLGKEAVLLEYKNEDHGLRGKANQEDYTKRIHDWFDHYLKGVAAADWIKGQSAPEPLPITDTPRAVETPAVSPATSTDPAR